MKTLKFWFLLHTWQFEAAQRYASNLQEQGYGLKGGISGWRVYRMFTRVQWAAMNASVEAEQETFTPFTCRKCGLLVANPFSECSGEELPCTH